jgi:hypothetical protein
LKFSATLFLATIVASSMAHAAKPYPGTNCTPFPADSWWQADISNMPVHARSSAWLKSMGTARNIWPDFGPSYGAISGPYGIPITVVAGRAKTVPVKFFYASESDNVKYPLSRKTKVEGWQFSEGDRHTISINKETCRLYETWATVKSGTTWSGGSGATWSLKSNALRPLTWTSGDAAGLPIFPGLLRYDEVMSQDIGHAIRFTTVISDNSFLWPARHFAGSVNDPNFPPMGARFRIKANYAIPASLRSDTKALLLAMKKYGIVLADNGAPWFFQGEADSRYPQAFLDEMKGIPSSIFEAVDTSSMKISNDSMQVR